MFPTHENRLELIKTLPEEALMAEVGVNLGEFSHAILCNTKVSRIYMVDQWIPYDGGIQKFTTEAHEEAYVQACRIALMHKERAVIVRQSSKDAAHNPSIPLLDAVYLDADHSYNAIYDDLIYWSYKLKPGGVLMGHDYIKTPQSDLYRIDVVQAVNDFCRRAHWKITALTDELFSSYRLERL